MRILRFVRLLLLDRRDEGQEDWAPSLPAPTQLLSCLPPGTRCQMQREGTQVTPCYGSYSDLAPRAKTERKGARKAKRRVRRFVPTQVLSLDTRLVYCPADRHFL